MQKDDVFSCKVDEIEGSKKEEGVIVKHGLTVIGRETLLKLNAHSPPREKALATGKWITNMNKCNRVRSQAMVGMVLAHP